MSDATGSWHIQQVSYKSFEGLQSFPTIYIL